MARFSVVRRGLLPYLVVSQTVPLIALAPLVASWGGRLQPFGLGVAAVAVGGRCSAAFLAFFPVSVGHASRARVGTGDLARVDA